MANSVAATLAHRLNFYPSPTLTTTTGGGSLRIAHSLATTALDTDQVYEIIVQVLSVCRLKATNTNGQVYCRLQG